MTDYDYNREQVSIQEVPIPEGFELVGKRKQKTKQEIIIERLVKSIDSVKKFEDIRLIEADENTLAYVNVEHKILYFNLNQNALSFPDFVKSLGGMVTHEAGHLDKRLHSPSTLEIAKQNLKDIKDPDLFIANLIYDLEVHHQYLYRRMIKPSSRINLRRFIKLLRNRLFEKDKSDVVLSCSYPTTELQKAIQKVIENRDYNFRKKYNEINKLLKKYKKEKEQEEELIIGIGGSKGKGKTKKKGKSSGKGKKESKKKKKVGTTITYILDLNNLDDKKKVKGKKKKKFKNKIKLPKKAKQVSIKGKIIEKHGEVNIQEKLKALGLSIDEIDHLCEKYPSHKLVSIVENLEKTLSGILPSINFTSGREKTKERIKGRGHRLNGFRKMRDISEVVENIEELTMLGKHSLNDIYVPLKIRRRTRNTIVILRDVSGSVSSNPLNKMIRDITVSLVLLAKKKQFRIGVIDFHSKVEPIRDRKGKVLSLDYNIIMAKSMLFKSGYSTLLSKALKFVNDTVKEQHLENDNLNLLIITDSYIDSESMNVKFSTKKNVNVSGLWCDEHDSISETFRKFMEVNKGKIYRIREDQEKNTLITDLFKDFSG